MTAIPTDAKLGERWVARFLRRYFGLYVLTMGVLLCGALIPNDLLGGGPHHLAMGLFQLGLVVGAAVVAIGARDSGIAMLATPGLTPSLQEQYAADDELPR